MTKTASELIDGRITEFPDWRGAMFTTIRRVIKQADPEVVETWKWRGVPVWEHDGILCTGEIYKAVVKMTFAKGASLPDPNKLFNSSLEGNTRRAIDLHEGDTLDEQALATLIRDAVALNKTKLPAKAKKTAAAKKTAGTKKPAKAKAKATKKTTTKKTTTKKAPKKRASKSRSPRRR